MPEIVCPLAEAAREYGNREAIITDLRIITYSEYDRQVTYTASLLKEKGVTSGHRVGIVLPNSIEYPILLVALYRLGAVACPVSQRWPARLTADYLAGLDCRTIITDTGSQDLKPYHRFDLIVVDEVVNTGHPAASSSVQPATISLEQAATVIATSGTSSLPKAVLHSYDNHYFSAIGSNMNITVRPGDRWLLSLPLYHVGGLAILFRTMSGGGAVVMPNSDTDLSDSIERYLVTHLSLVPTQLQHLLKTATPIDVIKRLAAVLVGGAPLPTSLVEQAYQAGLPLYTTYGLTEMASQVTTTRPGDPPDKLLTSGTTLKHRRLRIADDGEILTKGDTLFLGYVSPNGINLPLDKDGWFHTGDLGEIDNDGYLTIHGRRDNMFISGGENIHPEHLEGTMSLLSFVEEAVVIPIADSEFGHRPVAVIRTGDGRIVHKTDLIRQLEELVPRFMIPVEFYFWPDAIPDSGIKPARYQLRQLLESGKLTEIT
ncbi:MAG: o-succinylbenzoate--CoA ligase [bacterium]